MLSGKFVHQNPRGECVCFVRVLKNISYEVIIKMSFVKGECVRHLREVILSGGSIIRKAWHFRTLQVVDIVEG